MNKEILQTLDEELFTVHQSAAYLSVSVNTIRRWAQTKKLKGLKVGIRGDWRFTKVELAKMVRIKK